LQPIDPEPSGLALGLFRAQEHPRPGAHTLLARGLEVPLAEASGVVVVCCQRA
jgi:hypothetical protein